MDQITNQAMPSAAPAGNGIVPQAGWSWGGFMANAVLLIGAKCYKYLWWYLFAIIPFVNIVFFIVFYVYTGVKGHEIAARGTQFANQSEYDGFIRGIDHAGKVLFWVFIIFMALWIVFFALGVSFLGFFSHSYVHPGTAATFQFPSSSGGAY